MKRKNPCQDKRSKIETIAKKLIKETDNNIINSNMNEPSSNNKLTVADFFCGAGGFSEGFNLAGVDVVFGLDNWKPGITNTLFMPILQIPNTDDRFQGVRDLRTHIFRQ